ncbi:MAG: molybdopterin-dependent oxidoreductase [Duodenibacillus massiliensis]
MATKGDPEAPVNRGLNCIQSLFNAKILYGKDRLTQPLIRKKNGKFDKNGRFEPVSWEEALDENGENSCAPRLPFFLRKASPSVGSGQYTIPESLLRPVNS